MKKPADTEAMDDTVIKRNEALRILNEARTALIEYFVARDNFAKLLGYVAPPDIETYKNRVTQIIAMIDEIERDGNPILIFRSRKTHIETP